MPQVNLWSFTTDYPFAILVTFIPALINFCICIYVTFYLPKNKTNNLFACFVLFLGIWQSSEGMMHICTDEAASLVWYNMSGVPTIGVAIFEVLFAIRFTNLYRKMPYVLYYILLIIPAVLLLMFTIAGYDSYVLRKSDFWNWVASPEPSVFTDLLYAWISLSSLFTLVTFFIHFFRMKNNILKRKQSFLLLIGFAVPVIGGILAEVIEPLLLHNDSMPLTTPLVTCFSVTALIAIRRYGLLDYSPRHQWENILKSMNEGLVIIDLDNKIVYTNEKFNDLLDYTASDLENKYLQDLISDPTSKEIFLDSLEQRKKNIASQYQIMADKKDGSKVWLSVSGFPYVDKNGQIIGSVAVLADITELMNTQILLKDKINDLNLFFYKTSHDFKTPIASIQGLLECYDKDDNIDEFLYYVKMCIQNLSLIVGRVSQLSIIQQKQVFLNNINCKEIVDKIIAEIKSESGFEDSIHVNVAITTETMYSEKYLMQLIFKNLIENGVKYYDEDKDSPFVHVTVSRDDEYYKIQVSDNGLGIAPDIQEKVFNMFYRGNDKSKGPGLGLYIVKSAVEKLDGKVSVKSRLGRGSEFTVWIPAPLN